MRPFYAFLVSHSLATYVMLAAVHFYDPPASQRSGPMDGEDVLVLALSPLLSGYILLESYWRIATWPWHAACVWGSYLPAFFGTYYFVRWRWLPRLTFKGVCSKCGYDLRATPDRCPECGTMPAVKD